MDIVQYLPFYADYFKTQQQSCRIIQQQDVIEIYVKKNLRPVILKDNKIISVYPKGLSVYKISLPDGYGTYKIKIVNEINDEVYSKEITTETKLLHSTTMVNFDKLISYSKNLNSKKDIIKFLDNIKYSTEDLIEKEYVPDLTKVLKRNYGICVDYAALYCAFTRLNGIECRMVYGYRNNEYHAWCEEKVDNEYKIVDVLNKGRECTYKPVYYY